MRIIFTILFAVAAYMLYPPGVGDIPLSQLTLTKLIGFIGSLFNAGLAAWFLFKGSE
jgi:hypothetical protein